MTRAGKPDRKRGDGRLILGGRVQSMVPANPGWWARYRVPEPDGDWTAPIVAWAVIEDDGGHQKIVGVDPTGDDFHTWGGVVLEDVVYFFSPDIPGGHVVGVGDPGPAPSKG